MTDSSEAGSAHLRVQQTEEDSALEGTVFLKYQSCFGLAHDGCANVVGYFNPIADIRVDIGEIEDRNSFTSHITAGSSSRLIPE